VEEISTHRLTDRREEFRADWQRNLVHLLPPGSGKEFDDVWDKVVDYVTRTTDALKRDQGLSQ